jgi:hypothetical protein
LGLHDEFGNKLVFQGLLIFQNIVGGLRVSLFGVLSINFGLIESVLLDIFVVLLNDSMQIGIHSVELGQ